MTTTSLLPRPGAERPRISLSTWIFPVVLSAAGLLLGPACTDPGKQEEVLVDESEEELQVEMSYNYKLIGALFSPDGSRLVTYGGDERLVTYGKDVSARVWDAATGKPLTDPMLHDDPLTDPMLHGDDWIDGVSFSPDSQRIVTFGGNNNAGRYLVRVWDAVTGQLLFKPILQQEEIANAEFSPDGSMILVEANGVVFLIDASSGELLGKPLRHRGLLRQAAFSPDGNHLVTSGDTGVLLWSVPRNGPLKDPVDLEVPVLGIVQFRPDGSRLLWVNGEYIISWDLTNGDSVIRDLEGGADHGFEYTHMFFSRDATRICQTFYGSREVTLWDSSGYLMGEPLVHNHPTNGAEFSPDGRLLAVLCDMQLTDLEFSGEVVIWDVITCRQVGRPLRHPGVDDALFSPDGKTILTWSSDKLARLWDAKTSDPVGEPMFHSDNVDYGQFSPDGSRIVTTSGNTAYLWDAATSKRIGSSD